MIVNGHGRNLNGRVITALAAFVLVSIFALMPFDSSYAPLRVTALPFLAVAIIFGIVFIVLGWSELSLLESIENTPTVKIDGAANGLNEIQASVVPQYDTAQLMSPIGKKYCVFYQVELQHLVTSRNGSYWVTIQKYAKGIPLLLTDGTGYLAMDLEHANMDKISDTSLFSSPNRVYPTDKQNKIVYERDELGKKLAEYIGGSPDSFDPSYNGISLSSQYTTSMSKFSLFGGGELSLFERIIPVGETVFAMGRVIDTGKTFNGKPVKAMVFDRESRMLSFTSESKSAVSGSDKLLSRISFVLGIALFAIGAILFI